MLFANTQSIVNKIDETRAVVAAGDPDIVAFTETWTNETIDDSYLQINGYNMIIRNDRSDTEGGRGGGIVVYVKNEIRAWRDDAKSDFSQYGTMVIKTKNNEIRIHTVYRSPNSTRENDDKLCEWIRGMKGVNLLIGDFNFPDIEWDNGRAGSRGRHFYEAVADRFMEQHVEEKTHISGNILDLILSDTEGTVENVKNEGRIGRSDHEIITFTVNVNNEQTKERQYYRNYRRANFGEMRIKMKEVRWEEMLEDKDVNEMWSLIRSKIEQLTDENVPNSLVRNNNDPKWMNGEIRKCLKEKKKAWKRYKMTKTERDKDVYKQWEKKTKDEVKNAKKKLEREVIKDAKNNPKRFYSYINSARKTKSKIGPLKRENGEIVADASEKAEMLNSFFSSVFVRSTKEVPIIEKKTVPEINSIEVEEEDVREALGAIKDGSAPGPDGISTKVILELKEELVQPLTALFRASLETAKIPDEWRDAIVSPIYKKGKKTEPNNYRPVSLTSVFGKTLEKIVKKNLVRHIKTNNLLRSTQHGFRPGRSPQTNLIDFFNIATKWMDEGKSFDVLYLDFSKAFDVVDHERLMVKVEAIGIRGKLKDWIRNWLRDRRQRVKVDGCMSEWLAVLSSVIQGSVLGGTLFTIFIDDIDMAVIEALIRKFADDTKVARLIQSLEDAKKFQLVIDNLCEWAEEWEMAFNVAKCKILHFGRKNPQYEYTMQGKKIEVATEEKDLGVWVNTALKPTRQCEAAAKMANFTLGQIRRTFHYRKKSHFLPLYKTFVRPKLEHSVAAWCPWTEADIATLERVQQRAVRQISDKSGTTYEERLQSVGLMSLRERRVRGDAIETFKSLNGFNKIDKEEWFNISGPETRATRRTTSVTMEGEVRRKDSLCRQNFNLEVRKNFFMVRTVPHWNMIPDEIREQKSVNGFKNAYDRWRKGQPMELADGEQITIPRQQPRQQRQQQHQGTSRASKTYRKQQIQL